MVHFREHKVGWGAIPHSSNVLFKFLNAGFMSAKVFSADNRPYFLKSSQQLLISLIDDLHFLLSLEVVQ